MMPPKDVCHRSISRHTDHAHDGPRPFRVARGEHDALLAEQLVREVVPGVLIAADAPNTPATRAQAVQVLLGHEIDPDRGRAIGFASAAWLLTGNGGTGPGAAPATLDLVVGRNRRSPRMPGVRARQIDLPAHHLDTIEGVRLTHAVRTAADLARDLPQERALSLLRQLQELYEVHPPQVLAALAEMPYARGAAVARDVVRAWSEMA